MGGVVRRGHRLFAAGSVGLIAVAALHTVGHFTAEAPDAAGAVLLTAMQNYRMNLGLGMQPSLWDVQASLSLTMTITLVGLGFINLAVLAIAGETPNLIRRLTLLDVAIVGALVVLYGSYRIPPPFLTLFAVELLFIASLLAQRAADAGQ
jgi:hypothetical protein